MEQAKFTYSLLEKTFERQNKTKQKKTIEYQGEKQIKAIEYNTLIKKMIAKNIL